MTSRVDTLAGPHGMRLKVREWSRTSSPTAVMALVHGLAEHSGRYEAFAGAMNRSGIDVYAVDLPGHGRSEGPRCHVTSFADYLQAVQALIDRIRTRHPEPPVVLFGHSMGGLISASYLLKAQREVTACVLSSPAVVPPDPPSAVARFVLRLIAALAPRVGVMQVDGRGVSRDPHVVEAYQNDPLVHRGKISARLAWELDRAMRRLIERAGDINIPAFIVQAGRDILVDPQGAHLLHQTLSSHRKQIRVYEGLYHEVLNEPERDQVIADIDGWLKETLGKS